MPRDGKLITLELEPLHADIARSNLARAGFGKRVDIRVGPALDSLARLRSEERGPFDFTFIDADNVNTAAYFELAIALSRSGSAIVCDNVVRGGHVVDDAGDRNVQGVRSFFAALARDARVTTTALQNVGSKGYDGFALALVL